MSPPHIVERVDIVFSFDSPSIKLLKINYLKTYVFIKEVFPTPESPNVITIKKNK